MSKTKFVDFKAVKSAITMEQVLEHYGILDKFKRGTDSLNGPCPIHKGSNPTQFRVSVSKNIWNCFSECKHGGNVLDFIAEMDEVSIHAAALKAIEWFNLDAEAMSTESRQDAGEAQEKPDAAEAPKPRRVSQPAPAQEAGSPNKPLKFRLDKLEREHPYLASRGLTIETIVDFGVGYCAKGMMAERVATRKRVKGHELVTIGTMDTVLVDPRVLFRGALIAGTAAIVVVHNHPSGDPTPSEADIKVTRDIARGGQLLKIEVVDHVIIGNPNYSSLRELGWFYQ
jgi:DNA primase